MRLVAMTCPTCGAHINAPAGQAGTYCQFCGTQVYVDDEVQRVEQHIRYDNAEDAGYLFEKGRQRAQFEAGRLPVDAPYGQQASNEQTGRQQTYHTSGQAKKLSTGQKVLWGLGWICIFPIPLTILLLRNKRMPAKTRHALVAAIWGGILLIGFFGSLGSKGSESTNLGTDATKGVQVTEIDTVSGEGASEDGSVVGEQVQAELPAPEVSTKAQEPEGQDSTAADSFAYSGSDWDRNRHPSVFAFANSYNQLAEHPIVELSGATKNYKFWGKTDAETSLEICDFADNNNVDESLRVTISRHREVEDWEYSLFRDVIQALDGSISEDAIHASYYDEHRIYDNSDSNDNSDGYQLGNLFISYMGASNWNMSASGWIRIASMG